jgi:hypothetical protein
VIETPVDLDRLLDKLRSIEALHAGATTAGERIAAAEARQRIQQRLSEVEANDPPIEYKFTLTNDWSRTLFVALLRCYGLAPYRMRGQRHTTVMCKVSKRFVDETLCPEYVELDRELIRHLDEVTQRIVRDAANEDISEAREVAAVPQLTGGG